MITPADIESIVFPKKLSGYNPDAVDEFLDDIIIDMQKLIAENNLLKQKLITMEKEFAEARNSEDEAKKIMNDITESAEKRADAIVKSAYNEADAIKRNARDSVAILEKENMETQSKIGNFKEKYKRLLEDELDSLDTKFADIFGDINHDVKENLTETYGEKTPVTDNTIVKVREPENDKVSKDTIVVNSRDFEEMLMEDYSNIGDSVKFSGDDKNKTIII